MLLLRAARVINALSVILLSVRARLARASDVGPVGARAAYGSLPSRVLTRQHFRRLAEPLDALNFIRHLQSISM